MSVVLEIVLQFCMLSLLAFGGINALLPEIHLIWLRLPRAVSSVAKNYFIIGILIPVFLAVSIARS